MQRIWIIIVLLKSLCAVVSECQAASVERLTPFSTTKTTRTHFDYVVNEPALCQAGNKTAYAIIFVESRTTGFERREVVRSTWAKKEDVLNLGLSVFFLLGLSESQEVMQQVVAESQHYRDIIVADFMDSYRNLTLKTIAGLRWVEQHCLSSATFPPLFVVKADDDVFIDIFALKQKLCEVQANFQGVSRRESILAAQRHTIFGETPKLFMRIPERIKESKWYVTNEEYSGKIYPGK